MGICICDQTYFCFSSLSLVGRRAVLRITSKIFQPSLDQVGTQQETGHRASGLRVWLGQPKGSWES